MLTGVACHDSVALAGGYVVVEESPRGLGSSSRHMVEAALTRSTMVEACSLRMMWRRCTSMVRGERQRVLAICRLVLPWTMCRSTVASVGVNGNTEWPICGSARSSSSSIAEPSCSVSMGLCRQCEAPAFIARTAAAEGVPISVEG